MIKLVAQITLDKPIASMYSQLTTNSTQKLLFEHLQRDIVSVPISFPFPFAFSFPFPFPFSLPFPFSFPIPVPVAVQIPPRQNVHHRSSGRGMRPNQVVEAVAYELRGVPGARMQPS